LLGILIQLLLTHSATICGNLLQVKKNITRNLNVLPKNEMENGIEFIVKSTPTIRPAHSGELLGIDYNSDIALLFHHHPHLL
jgi:hypothetical protein